MEYNFISIEEKWQKYWREKKVYSSSNNSDLPKYYVLDMFPYPSGSGLHVGHPLGYIASDIISRYKTKFSRISVNGEMLYEISKVVCIQTDCLNRT